MSIFNKIALIFTIYILIAGGIAGSVIQDRHDDCGLVLSHELRSAYIGSLFWPLILVSTFFFENGLFKGGTCND